MVTDADNIKKLALDLERQELEASAGVLNPELYAQLLAIYLYQNDLCNAKFLWKRIPQATKSSHAELGLIWKVGQLMWQRDFPAVYEALSAEWSENIARIMEALRENVRKRAVHLISHAYSSISMDDLAMFVGMTCNDALNGATEQGWQVDMPLRMVSPCKPTVEPCQITSNEDQLDKLTEFVSFLEN